ncbi:nuclear speckle splicing regulatory protein 1 [Caerostris extrusa]|uniref:Nuclear speckle splicing regulatory protein 1 n=1 Tax=Caerostris extrusa TaxID=172846 RepID=A0AAV4XV17_CAEEX|nr:nuclear speckle splicing regulatory protein 1 [Caerostris extrusa]
MNQNKPFGLILPKKHKALQVKTSAIFGSDSDDEPAKKKSIPIPQKKAPSKKLRQEVCEDPSIYEYDSIYDDMKAKESCQNRCSKGQQTIPLY